MIGGPGVDRLFGQGGNDILVGASATVRSAKKDSLRKVLTDDKAPVEWLVDKSLLDYAEDR